MLEYEPDADMIFNYLMVSALAAATDYVERNGIKPTGGNFKILARLICRPLFQWVQYGCSLRPYLCDFALYCQLQVSKGP